MFYLELVYKSGIQVLAPPLCIIPVYPCRGSVWNGFQLVKYEFLLIFKSFSITPNATNHCDKLSEWMPLWNSRDLKCRGHEHRCCSCSIKSDSKAGRQLAEFLYRPSLSFASVLFSARFILKCSWVEFRITFFLEPISNQHLYCWCISSHAGRISVQTKWLLCKDGLLWNLRSCFTSGLLTSGCWSYGTLSRRWVQLRDKVGVGTNHFSVYVQQQSASVLLVHIVPCWKNFWTDKVTVIQRWPVGKLCLTSKHL